MARNAPGGSIRNVIFDFGGVLIRWRPEEIIRDFYPDETLRDAVRRAVFEHSDWIELDRGALSEALAAERFAARARRPAEEMRRLLENVRNSLTPVAESFEIVTSVARQGFAVYALSNMPAATFAHLRSRYDCWDAFAGIVISGEIGMIKPDPQIFHYIARRYSLVPDQTVFVRRSSAEYRDERPAGLQVHSFLESAAVQRRIVGHAERRGVRVAGGLKQGPKGSR